MASRKKTKLLTGKDVLRLLVEGEAAARHAREQYRRSQMTDEEILRERVDDLERRIYALEQKGDKG